MIVKLYKIAFDKSFTVEASGQKFKFKDFISAYKQAEYLAKVDCEKCFGTGEVSCMGYVFAGEPHMADVETRPCDCQLKTNEE